MCDHKISGRVSILEALLTLAYSTIHIFFFHVLALDLIKAFWQLELQHENCIQKQRNPFHEIAQILVFSVFSWLAPVLLHCIVSFYMTHEHNVQQDHAPNTHLNGHCQTCPNQFITGTFFQYYPTSQLKKWSELLHCLQDSHCHIEYKWNLCLASILRPVSSFTPKNYDHLCKNTH